MLRHMDHGSTVLTLSPDEVAELREELDAAVRAARGTERDGSLRFLARLDSFLSDH